MWSRSDLGDIGLTWRYKLFGHIRRIIKPALAGLLAVALGLCMAKYKLRTCQAGGREVRFASLLRRGVAMVIDVLLVVGPFAALAYARFMALLEGGLSIWGMVTTLGLLFCGGVLWLLLWFFLLSLMEGKAGLTPGKWVVGLRVLRDDLQPCGFGRGLLRNLLRLLDGLVWYLPGMLVAALTAKWQRLGDLAAKTIVIRKPPAAPHAGH